MLPELLAAALSWSAPYRSPEPADAYQARVATIVEAASLESRSPAEAAAVVVLAYAESGFRRGVHDGSELGDNGKATCVLQVHPHAADWHRLAGHDLDSTRRCVAAGLRVLRYTLTVCGRGVTDPVSRHALGFEGYARGTCHAPSAESWKRARQWARVVGIGGVS